MSTVNPYGQKISLYVAAQDSLYDPNTTVDSWHQIAFVSEDIKFTQETLRSQSMRGIFEEGEAYRGLRGVAGSVQVEAHPIDMGVWLRAAIGQPSSINSDAIYTHRFVPPQIDYSINSALRPFQIAKMGLSDDLSRLYYGLNATDLELSVANGDFLKATVGFVGGKVSDVATTATNSYTGADNLFTWQVASLSIGAAGVEQVVDLSIKVANGIEALHALGSDGFPTRIKRTGFRTVEISGTARFESSSDYDDFVNYTERELILHFEGVTEIQSGYYESLTVTVPSMRYTDYPLAAGGPGVIEVGFSAIANYDVGSGAVIAFTLVNTKAGYWD